MEQNLTFLFQIVISLIFNVNFKSLSNYQQVFGRMAAISALIRKDTEMQRVLSEQFSLTLESCLMVL